MYYSFTTVFSFLWRCRIFVDTHFVVDTSEGQGGTCLKRIFLWWHLQREVGGMCGLDLGVSLLRRSFQVFKTSGVGKRNGQSHTWTGLWFDIRHLIFVRRDEGIRWWRPSPPPLRSSTTSFLSHFGARSGTCGPAFAVNTQIQNVYTVQRRYTIHPTQVNNGIGTRRQMDYGLSEDQVISLADLETKVRSTQARRFDRHGNLEF